MSRKSCRRPSLMSRVTSDLVAQYGIRRWTVEGLRSLTVEELGNTYFFIKVEHAVKQLSWEQQAVLARHWKSNYDVDPSEVPFRSALLGICGLNRESSGTLLIQAIAVAAVVAHLFDLYP